VLAKFGEQHWDDDHYARGESYRTVADLAEDSIYGFARFYILRAILAEHNARVLTPDQALEEIQESKFRGD
jgi:hypothetical protein